jgi:hypothetical protein
VLHVQCKLALKVAPCAVINVWLKPSATVLQKKFARKTLHAGTKRHVRLTMSLRKASEPGAATASTRQEATTCHVQFNMQITAACRFNTS